MAAPCARAGCHFPSYNGRTGSYCCRGCYEDKCGCGARRHGGGDRRGDADRDRRHGGGRDHGDRGGGGGDHDRRGDRKPRDDTYARTVVEVVRPGSVAGQRIDVALTDPSLAGPGPGNPFTLPPGVPGSLPPERLLCLDFHGVTDLFAEDAPAFAGAEGKIRDATRESLRARIAAGQIRMAVLVFRKLRAADVPAETDFGGIKRAAIDALLKANGASLQHVAPNGGGSPPPAPADAIGGARYLFVDDSQDNVATVASLQHPAVKSLFFKGRADALPPFLAKELAAVRAAPAGYAV